MHVFVQDWVQYFLPSAALWQGAIPFAIRLRISQRYYICPSWDPAAVLEEKRPLSSWTTTQLARGDA